MATNGCANRRKRIQHYVYDTPPLLSRLLWLLLPYYGSVLAAGTVSSGCVYEIFRFNHLIFPRNYSETNCLQLEPRCAMKWWYDRRPRNKAPTTEKKSKSNTNWRTLFSLSIPFIPHPSSAPYSNLAERNVLLPLRQTPLLRNHKQHTISCLAPPRFTNTTSN